MFSVDNFAIRPVDYGDEQFLLEVRNNHDTWIYLDDIRMVSIESQKQWITKLASNFNNRYFIVLKDNISIGMARLTQIDMGNRSICIGYDMHPDYRGQGYIYNIYKMLLTYCYDFLNINRVFLLTMKFNTRALHVYKKIGFREEGVLREYLFRNGKYEDAIIMSFLEKEWRIM